MSTNRFAFFDVDETLIRTKSMFDFFRFLCRSRGDVAALQAFDEEFAALFGSGLPREILNQAYYRHLAGFSPAELQLAGELWWLETASRPSIIIEESLSFLHCLAMDNIAPVFVSGSFKEILEPVAAQFGVRHILCAPMLMGPEGIYTGEIGPTPSIGQGKRIAVQAFLKQHGTDPAECWAVGDDLSDLPMLEAVGHRAIVGALTPLACHARDQGWTVLGSGMDCPEFSDSGK